MTTSFVSVLTASLLSMTFFTGEALAEDKKDPDWGLGASARHIMLTKGVMKTFFEDAPGGTREQGASLNFTRRRDDIEFNFSFGYDRMSPSDGFYLDRGGQATTPTHVDFVEWENLEQFTLDFTMIGYLELHHILHIRYGAGLGVGIVRGDVFRTDALCTGDSLQTDCSIDEMGPDQRAPEDIPPALPVLNGLVGISLRPVNFLAINLDVGIHNVPYLGLGATMYLW